MTEIISARLRNNHPNEEDLHDAADIIDAPAARIAELTDERDRQYEQNAEFIVKIAELEGEADSLRQQLGESERRRENQKTTITQYREEKIAQAARIKQLEAALAMAREEALREVFLDVKTFAPHEEYNTGPEHDIGYASGYHTALHRIADLINKEPTTWPTPPNR